MHMKSPTGKMLKALGADGKVLLYRSGGSSSY